MKDYEVYELNLKKNNKRNDKFLKIFEKWLNEQKLTKKTINKHLCNVDLYINDYLNYYEITNMEAGVNMIYTFLDDWFIRKCMWSSVSSIKDIVPCFSSPAGKADELIYDISLSFKLPSSHKP